MKSLRHSSFSIPSIALPTSQLILQPFRRFTYITARSPTLLSLYIHHSSILQPSVALPTSQLILEPLRHFTYITANSPTLPSLYLHHSSFSYLPSLYLHHSSFSNPSVALTTSQNILQPFRCFVFYFDYIYSNIQIAHGCKVSINQSPMSQLILQPFRRFTYVTEHSPALPLLT